MARVNQWGGEGEEGLEDELAQSRTIESYSYLALGKAPGGQKTGRHALF